MAKTMVQKGVDCMQRGSGFRACFRAAACALLCVVWGLGFPLSAGAQDPQKQTRIVVSSPGPVAAFQQLHRIEDGTLILDRPVTFNVRAFLQPTTAPAEAIYAQKKIALPEKVFVCQDWPCTQKWDLDFSDQSVSLFDLPRLQMAWTQSPLGPTPDITVDLEIVHGRENRESVVLQGRFTQKSRLSLYANKTLDMKQAEYVQKSRWYLAKRELGLKADDRWRYDQTSKGLWLQARVDVPIKEAQAVQVFFNPQQPIEAVQFSVDADGNGRRDHFITFHQTRHDLKRLPNQSVLTIDLQDAIKALGIDPEKAALQEPIILLPGAFSTYQQNRPIHKIVFASVDRTEYGELIAPEVDHKGGRYFLEFDFLPALEKRSIWEAKINTLRIRAGLDGPQVIHWDTVRMADVWEKQLPVIQKEPGKAIEQWLGSAEAMKSVLGPGEEIESFRPLLWIWGEKVGQPSPLSAFAKARFEDPDIEITADHTWYHVTKEKNCIQTSGIFTNANSRVRLKIRPYPKPLRLTFEGTQRNSIILQQYGDKNLGLPLRYFLRGGGGGHLSLPEDTPIILIMTPSPPKKGETGHDTFFEDWNFKITAKPGEPFSGAIWPETPLRHQQEIWKTSLLGAKGRVFPWLAQGPVLEGKIRWGIPNQGKTAIIALHSGINQSLSGMEPGMQVLGFEPDENWVSQVESTGYELGFLDIVFKETGSPSDLSALQWWSREGELAFVSQDPGATTEKWEGKTVLFPEEQETKKWIFPLEKKDFIAPVSLMVPEPIPPICRASLRINGEKIPLPGTQEEFPLNGYNGKPKDISLELEYLGDDPLLLIKLPMLKVMGLRHTPYEGLRQTRVRIDGQTVGRRFTQLPAVQGEWVDLGPVSLEPGQHAISVKEGPHFTIERLSLETDETLSWPKEDMAVATPLWKRMAMFGIKFLAVVGALAILYLFRSRVRAFLGFFFRPIKRLFSRTYWRLPDLGWVVVWTLIAVSLYGQGLSKKTGGENYGFTFGGMALVLGLWHMSRILKSAFFRRFPRAAGTVYGGPGKPFFAWAIGMLVLTAMLLAVNLEPLAEQVAIVVYYLLVVGVVGEIMALRKERKTEPSEEESQP